MCLKVELVRYLVFYNYIYMVSKVHLEIFGILQLYLHGIKGSPRKATARAAVLCVAM